jgi:Tn3 transposase DDE domain-containing protein
VLLRFLSEPALRETITVITNRVESFHRFATWFGFGAEEGVLAANDPVYQEKLIKFNQLVANRCLYSTAVDLTTVINQLVAGGWRIDPEDVATLSPLIISTIRRFGHWRLDLTPPEATGDGHLALPVTEPADHTRASPDSGKGACGHGPARRPDRGERGISVSGGDEAYAGLRPGLPPTAARRSCLRHRNGRSKTRSTDTRWTSTPANPSGSGSTPSDRSSTRRASDSGRKADDLHIRRMRRNRRISSLPASKARHTTAANAANMRHFIIGPFFQPGDLSRPGPEHWSLTPGTPIWLLPSLSTARSPRAEGPPCRGS